MGASENDWKDSVVKGLHLGLPPKPKMSCKSPGRQTLSKKQETPPKIELNNLKLPNLNEVEESSDDDLFNTFTQNSSNSLANRLKMDTIDINLINLAK